MINKKAKREIKWLFYYGNRGPRAICNLYKITKEELEKILNEVAADV